MGCGGDSESDGVVAMVMMVMVVVMVMVVLVVIAGKVDLRRNIIVDPTAG